MGCSVQLHTILKFPLAAFWDQHCGRHIEEMGSHLVDVGGEKFSKCVLETSVCKALGKGTPCPGSTFESVDLDCV